MLHMDERVDPTNLPQLVGLIGGTGPLGTGLARRLAGVVGEVRLGSREAGRAADVAASLPENVVGVANSEAARAEIVFVTVPWSSHRSVLESLAAELAGRIVVDCVNPLGFDADGPFAIDVPEGSAAEQAAAVLPGSTVVAAFHHVPASLLQEDAALDLDVMVVGDDGRAVEQVIGLIDGMGGLHGIAAGRLRNAGQVEALTANLIAINRRYRVHSGVRITGIHS